MSGLDHNRLVAQTIAELKSKGFGLDAAPKLGTTGKSGVEVFVDALALATVEEIENHYSGTSGTGTDSILNSLVGDGVPKRTGTVWAMVNDLLTQSAADLRYATPLSVTAAVATRQAVSNDLTAIADASGTGYLKKIASGIWNLVASIPWADLSGVPSVTAGTGLTGGGVLTAGITLAVAFAGTGAAATASRSDHTHTASQISDSTTTGRSVLLAADQASARTALGLTAWATKAYTNGSTTDVAEGSNLYYTDARARAAITATLPIIATAGVISHSTADGNLHVPATGTTSNGKWLKAGATAGAISWQALTAGDLPGTASTFAGLANGDGCLRNTGSGVLSWTPVFPIKSYSSTGLGNFGGSGQASAPALLSATDNMGIGLADGRSLSWRAALVSSDSLWGLWQDASLSSSLKDFVIGDGTGSIWYRNSPLGSSFKHFFTGNTQLSAGLVVVGQTTLATSLTGMLKATAGVVSTASASDLPSHTHTASQISDSTATGRSVLLAADQASARTAIGLTGWATKAYTNGSTTDVAEGSNLYYTDARARAAITATTPIIATAGVISHSAADGNLHVPATGTSSNGKWLKAGATAGSGSWQSIYASDLPSHIHSVLDLGDSGTIGVQLMQSVLAAGARSVLGLTGWAIKAYTNGSTTDVAEGSNLYYTDARARASITATSPIINTAGVLSHSTADGNLHVPATGTTSSGKFLRSGASAGSASWQWIGVADIPFHASTHHWNGTDPLVGQSIAGLLVTSTPQFAGLLLTGNVLVNQDTLFAANSIDGNDQSAITICGGGSSTTGRGAFVQVRGNERPSSGGTLTLAAGDGVQGNIEFSTGATLRATLTKAGELNVSSGALRVGSFSGFLAATSGLLRAGTASDLPGSAGTLAGLANGNGVLRNTGAGTLSWQACLPIQSYSTLGFARAAGDSVYAYQILSDTGIGFGDARGLNWRGGFFGNHSAWWGFRQDASLSSSFKPFVIGDYISDLYTIDRYGTYVHTLSGTASVSGLLRAGAGLSVVGNTKLDSGLTGVLKAFAGDVSVAGGSDLPAHASRHHATGDDPLTGQEIAGLLVTSKPTFTGLYVKETSSNLGDLAFLTSTGVRRMALITGTNANGGGLAVYSYNDVGSYRGTRLFVPRSDSFPVSIENGLEVFSGSLTLNTSFNGLLKATAGVVSVAALGSLDPAYINVPSGRIPFGGSTGLTYSDNLRFNDPYSGMLWVGAGADITGPLYADDIRFGTNGAIISSSAAMIQFGDGVTNPRVRFPVTSTGKAFQVDGLATFAHIDAYLLEGDVQADRDEITSGTSRTLPPANLVGRSVRFCAGIGPGTYQVSVDNSSTELIFYRSRTTGVRSVATSLDIVDSATEFVCHAIGRWTAIGF